RRAHVEVVRDAERDDARARRGGGARQRPLRVRRDGRGMAARGEHADEGQNLDLAASPGALRVDVQHAHHPSSPSRARMASATHMAIATSASPKVYCVSPPTSKPNTPAQAPAAAP